MKSKIKISELFDPIYKNPTSTPFSPILKTEVSSIMDLPNEVIDKLQTLLDGDCITLQSCIVTSLNVGRIKGVNIEKGWWGSVFTKEKIQNFIQNFKRVEIWKDGYLKCWDTNSELFYIDTIKNIRYSFHYWNSYKGIHFDLLNLCREYQVGKEYTQMKYIRGSSYSIESIFRKYHKHREVINEYIDSFIVSDRYSDIKNGYIILNRTIGGVCSIEFPNVIDIREMCNDKNELKIAS